MADIATVDQLDARGKRVLVRVDFNVPVADGVCTDDTRIRAALPTIRKLIDEGARVILMSHLGRPAGEGFEEKFTLRPAALRLSELLGRPVAFASDTVGPDAQAKAAALQDGQVLVLENLRFDKREKKNDPEFCQELAKLGEAYVNDAFGTAHRAHASTAGVAALLPAFAGYLMQNEVATLTGMLDEPRRPFIAILGGSKVSDKIKVIDALMEAVGDELNKVRQFYEDLRDKRNIQTAVGKQLDGIGDNAVLTRLEAGALACAKESVYVLDDDAYRTYLIYKIWKNTNNCTYYDIIRAFKMFWDKPLHYREDPAIPATMIFETDALTPEADVSKLLNAPFIKAAGVAILVVANTEAPEMVADVPVEGILGRGYTTTTLPEIETGEAFIDTVLPVPAAQNITQTKLPELEEDEI